MTEAMSTAWQQRCTLKMLKHQARELSASNPSKGDITKTPNSKPLARNISATATDTSANSYRASSKATASCYVRNK